MRHLVPLGLLCAATMAWGQGMTQDPEARALLARFQALPVAGQALADDFNAATERRVTGPVTFAPGREGQGNAAWYPETRDEAVYLYYGPRLPRAGHLSLDFMLPAQRPRDHNFLTLLSVGTAGNTKLMVRLNAELRPWVGVLTKREQVSLTGDPVSPGQWHRLEWWYDRLGSVLVVDGVIQDYSTDPSVPYAVEVGEACYLGDQPWWDSGGRKGVFYPLDSFVGALDNLQLHSLQ